MGEARLTGNLFIDGPAGRLEAIFKPAGDSDRLAVVAHPHPAHGGTMHNKVVYRAAQALNQARVATLRFNFRGVGLSEGAYDEGRGERDDLRAVLDYAGQRYAVRQLIVGGFSFGAWVGLDVGCRDPRVGALVGIGTPLRILRGGALDGLSSCAKPKLFVQGTQDQYGPLAELETWYQGLPEPKQLVAVGGAGHFFEGHLDELMAAIRNYFSPQPPEPA
jgi:alpha/beta superfamily hydrolase